MSQSYAHDGGRDPDGDPPGESLSEQLAAEIADHLASAAGDLKRRGAADDEAARRALAQFGDVARIKRQCWWIHNQEEVMFRTAGIALLCLVAIGVAVVGFGGWQLQRSFASRTAELSEQLASLTATQQAMLAQQRPPEIAGRAYLGDPSVPAKDVEIQIFRFSEQPAAGNSGSGRAPGVVTRRVRTDAQGRFDSGILQSGEYCLLAPLIDPAGKVDKNQLFFSQLQSRPLYLTAGVGQSTLDLNLAASGQLCIAATDIPSSVTIAGREHQLAFKLALSTDGGRYFEQQPVPPSDEPPSDGWPLPLPRIIKVAGGMVEIAKLPHTWLLPPRTYLVRVNLMILPNVVTKPIPCTVKLAPGAVATLTVDLPADSLEKRFEAAAKELEALNPADSPAPAYGPSGRPPVGSSGFLQSVLAGIELIVTVASEEPAIAH